MKEGLGQEYYIGANTARGFVNYAPELFDGLRKVYIIKGGPGTGKSTMMKRVAAAAEAQGMTVDRFVCSSDGDSLDGIRIRELSVGMTDGTTPHVMEPLYPGTRDELIDPGAYWDSEALSDDFEEIRGMVDGKAVLFSSAYQHLAACASLRSERNRLLAACTDGEKLDRAAARLIKRLGEGKGFRLLARQVGSLGMKGRRFLDTYETMAEERWLISDSRGLRGLLLERMTAHAAKAGLAVMISRDPVNQPEALYFPEAAVCVSGRGDAETAHKILNTERFLLRESLASERGKLRFLARMEGELEARVAELFREIEDVHFALEGRYAEAMDYAGVDAMTADLIRKLGL